ncbi:MAG: hypothetical protein PWP23_2891 [Candidatus Sumerlaeota bacterium]|nr:hypothetical protein [Candidatus Sumerlaeota bacterium]
MKTFDLLSLTRNTLGLASLAAVALLPALSSAQGGFATGFADFEAMDTLNSGSTGAGGTGQLALDRARGVAGGGSSYGADPFGAPASGGTTYGADPFGAPAGGGAAYSADPFGAAGGGGAAYSADPFGGAVPGAGTYQPPSAYSAGVVQGIPKVVAIYGERVICPVTGNIISDAVEVPVFQTYVDQYYDDGANGLDYKANDQIYTNVTLVTDRMDPEAHLVKTRLIQGLRTLERLEPNAFFNIPVSSTDPLAGVPQVIDLEEDRDKKLADWADRFLNEFRVNPEAGTGEWDFFETYMPVPPYPPLEPIPGNFYPPFDSKEAEEAAAKAEEDAQGGLAGRVGTDAIEPNAGASSAYF